MSIDNITGLPLNDDGTVRVFHATDRESAQKIVNTKRLKSQGEPDVFVSTSSSVLRDHGRGVLVQLYVNPENLIIDDEFPDGRLDFRIPTGRQGGSIRIKNPRIVSQQESVDRMREEAPTNNAGSGNVRGVAPGEDPPGKLPLKHKKDKKAKKAGRKIKSFKKFTDDQEVNESFDFAYDWWIEHEMNDQFEAQFEIPGTEQKIELVAEYMRNEDFWYVVFLARDNRGKMTFDQTDLMGSKSIKVMSTIKDIIEYLIMERNPSALVFSADKTNRSRVTLYRSLVKKFIPRDYEWITKDQGNTRTFIVFDPSRVNNPDEKV